jgi:hypothetical protein
MREEFAEALAPTCRSACNRCDIFDKYECLHKPEHGLGHKSFAIIESDREMMVSFMRLLCWGHKIGIYMCGAAW